MELATSESEVYIIDQLKIERMIFTFEAVPADAFGPDLT